MKFDLRNGLWSGAIGSGIFLVFVLFVWIFDLTAKKITIEGLFWATLTGFILLGAVGTITDRGPKSLKRDDR